MSDAPRDDDLHPLLKTFEGRPATVSGRAKDPVNSPMIRHWCEAMGDANPAYTGDDAIAPPTMLQAWLMGGLSGRGRARSTAYEQLFEMLRRAGYTAIVATDCEQEYPRPLRPGDLPTFDTVIESVSPRKTTRLGAGHFITTRTEVRVNGRLVGTHRFRVLTYAPAPGPVPAAVRTDRPRPVVNRDNAGFWEGVAAHRLLIQRCDACAALRFPWLPGCGRCGSPEWSTVEASGAGTVFSYVIVHHPPAPGLDPPYAVGLVELAEGVRMISNITGAAAERVRIGMAVALEFVRVDADLEIPVFRALPDGAAG
ncbi:bifunctional MaoC family dehydratase N-terminal/OB-fold nucleic acid binding domain-containing protein [Streptomyces sp. ISL-11]|uniref:bifunctional MaoC family dehydratase N-terminal/OB-fold nucleic acid binding domain-containing protein n=1 Tax=Streptomyces sp. ISL-11 TaxID=2819174 RepID=UPI001BE6DAE9|nr:bifunctional MaoC family dehydratase N-terminal/OB-fold nucleic acid binding domain-containing protein [Streptomyces sp. ISL-11]MBT2384444.1 bifunctional MaoC family dehydratase/OB-fold nucleic acid binding domain-containing protein [Streptomyces sp. ISL-11]